LTIKLSQRAAARAVGSSFSARRSTSAELAFQLPSLSKFSQDFEVGIALGFLFEPRTSNFQLLRFPGGLIARVTPVPIPNTEVKPC
jgi:hypothetical protein